MPRHDFQRTALGDMANDGTPEKVAMLITGHKTRTVFDRYHHTPGPGGNAVAEPVLA